MRGHRQRQLQRPQRDIRPLGAGGGPRPYVVEDPHHHVQRIGRRQHRGIQRGTRRPRDQQLRIAPGQHAPPVERIGEHLLLGRPEPHHEVPRQRDPADGRARPPGHLHPHHRQQDRQPPPPFEHLVEQRRLQSLVVAGRAPEPVALPEQSGRRDRPRAGFTGPVRHQPRQPVQFDPGGVDPRLVERPVTRRADQQTQQGQVGPLGPRLLGEPPPHLVGPPRLRRTRGRHSRLMPAHDALSGSEPEPEPEPVPVRAPEAPPGPASSGPGSR